MKTKICTKCKTEKFLSEFSRGIGKDGLTYWCKNCHREYQIIKQKEIKEYRKIYNKNHKEEQNEYYQNNKEKYIKQAAEYYRNHKKQIIKKKNEYIRNRIKTDVSFKLRYYLSSRVWSALKGKSKSAKTMELVGCSVEFLKTHLEYKFEKGMTWENYGKWHIDHIRPCASFDLSKPEEQSKCFNYTNLQPLWAADNLSKNDKY